MAPQKERTPPKFLKQKKWIEINWLYSPFVVVSESFSERVVINFQLGNLELKQEIKIDH